MLIVQEYKTISPFGNDFFIWFQTDYSTYLSDKLKFFYANASFSIPYGKRWSWPFLDIFLLNLTVEKDGTEFLMDNLYKLKFPVNSIYPVKKAYFLGTRVSVPNEIDNVLKETYGSEAINMCVSNYMDHRHVTSENKTVEVKCSKLGIGTKTGATAGIQQLLWPFN